LYFGSNKWSLGDHSFKRDLKKPFWPKLFNRNV